MFGKAGSVFWDKQASFLEKNRLHVWESRLRFGGKLAWFLDWLATKLKFHCFERKACLGLDLGFF